MGRFEFVVLATLRANQLNRGCLSRVDGIHLRAVTAQLEVAGGHVVRLLPPVITNTPE
jgi:DNA-directed RNA polymerase subunit K/omega